MRDFIKYRRRGSYRGTDRIAVHDKLAVAHFRDSQLLSPNTVFLIIADESVPA